MNDEHATEEEVRTSLLAATKERLLVAQANVSLDTPDDLHADVTNLRLLLLSRGQHWTLAECRGAYRLAGDLVARVAHVKVVS